MKTFKYWHIAIYMVCAGLAACASYAVFNNASSTFDQKTDFSKYKSFTWLPDKDSANNAYNNAGLRENARRHITNLLSERGVVLNPSQSDLLMDVVIITLPKEKMVNIPLYTPYAYPYPFYSYNYFGYGYYPYYSFPPPQLINAYETRRVIYQDCSLNLKVYDKASQKLIWTGSSSGEILFKEDVDKDYYKAATVILEKYPVKSRKDDKLFQ